jgi:hypothetical protein
MVIAVAASGERAMTTVIIRLDRTSRCRSGDANFKSDLIAPHHPPLELRLHAPPARRKILHFAKTARAENLSFFQMETFDFRRGRRRQLDGAVGFAKGATMLFGCHSACEPLLAEALSF